MSDARPALVSVMVPSYNHERYLPQLLESVAQQTWPRVELVVIDDGSKDTSVALLEAARARLESKLERVVFRSRENRGVSATQNELLSLVTGEFVFFSASDDRLLPTALTQLMALLEPRKDAVLACGDARFIDAESHVVHLEADGRIVEHATETSRATSLLHSLRARPHLFDSPEFGTHHSLLGGNYLPVGLLIRRADALAAGPYPSGLVLDDLFFWLRLSRRGRFLMSKEITMEYRVHPTSVSRTRQTRMRRDYFEILLDQREYCRETGHLKEWQEALEGTLSLRQPDELWRATRAGMNVPKFLARRGVQHLRRLAGRLGVSR